MTMLDDDRLSSLFETAAGAFEVPADGPRDIVARALGSPPDADVGAVEGGDDDSAGDPGDDPGTGDATSPATPLSPRRARGAVAAARRHRVLVGGRVPRRAAPRSGNNRCARHESFEQSTAEYRPFSAQPSDAGAHPDHCDDGPRVLGRRGHRGAGRRRSRAGTLRTPTPNSVSPLRRGRRRVRRCRRASWASPPRSSRRAPWG